MDDNAEVLYDLDKQVIKLVSKNDSLIFTTTISFSSILEIAERIKNMQVI